MYISLLPDGGLALLPHSHGLQHPLQRDVHLRVAAADHPVGHCGRRVTLLLEVPKKYSIKYISGNINQEEIYTLKISLKGGTDAIFEVKDNLASGQPCVVVEVSLQ